MNGFVVLLKELVLGEKSSTPKVAWLVGYKSRYRNKYIWLNINNTQVF